MYVICIVITEKCKISTKIKPNNKGLFDASFFKRCIMHLMWPNFKFPPLPSSSFSSYSFATLSFISISLYFSLPPHTSDPTKKLSTVPHNEVRFFHMLMLLLTAQCTAQHKARNRAAPKNKVVYTHMHTDTHTNSAGMATVTMNPNELPLSCLQLW